MLYITIISIVCAAVAPVGTLLSFGSSKHGDDESVVATLSPTDATRTDINEISKRPRGRRLLQSYDTLTLDLNADLGEEPVRMAWRPQPKSPESRRRRRTNLLRDVRADDEVDMNKRIAKLARESSINGGEMEDSIKGEDEHDEGSGETSLAPADGMREVMEIFAAGKKERRRLLWVDGPGSQRRRRRKRRRRRWRRRRPRRGPPRTPSPKAEFRRGLLKNPFRHWTGVEDKTQEVAEAADGLVTSKNDMNCTACMGVFERKMKEFHARQKLRNATRKTLPTAMPPPDVMLAAMGTSQTTELPTSATTPTTVSTTDVYEGNTPRFVEENTGGATVAPQMTTPTETTDDLSLQRYLQLRHSLRTYLTHRKLCSPRRRGRRKRCNKYMCRCRKKSPPLICLPYIKQGQDDMLKYMINVMQKMLDKACNSEKPYSLGKINKCKPCKIVEEPCEVCCETEVSTCCLETTTPAATPMVTPAPCNPPIAIFPFPLPFPTCACVPNTCPQPAFPPMTTCLPVMPPYYQPPTCPPCFFQQTCPPAVFTFPVCPPTTQMQPTTASPFSFICPTTAKPQTTLLPYSVFEPCSGPPAFLVQSGLPPWPTTKMDVFIDSCTQRGPLCLDTLPPWPSQPPPFFKTNKQCSKNQHQKQRDWSAERLMDYGDDFTQTFRQGPVCCPDGSKMSVYDFETMYDSPAQETVEQSQIDVRYEQDEVPRGGGLAYGMATHGTPPTTKAKPRRHRRRRKRLKKGRNHFRDGYPEYPDRWKRDDPEMVVLETTSPMVPTLENHRNECGSYLLQDGNALRKQSTMKSAGIVRGPKRLSNHPPAKVFATVYPESYANSSTGTGNVTGGKTTAVTPSAADTSSSLLHLQLLAVCEGYLQMIKLLNRTNDDNIDLERYCEDEISKSLERGQQSKSTTPLAATPITGRNLRNKVVVDILGSPVYREMRAKSLLNSRRRRRRRKRRRGHRKLRRRRRKRTTVATSTEEVGDSSMDSNDLTYMKKVPLVSRLLSKDKDTEYVDDVEEGPQLERSEVSTTTTATTTATSSVRRPDIVEYPVYAKGYGYDKGEIGEIEVLWRNATRDIVKNATVLAMLMNPEELERDDASIEGNDELLSSDNGDSAWKRRASPDDAVGGGNGTLEAGHLGDYDLVNEMMEDDETTTTTTLIEVSNAAEESSSHVTNTTPAGTTTSRWNGTYSRAVSTAKDLVKDYTIEFLNYAVYIIPIMFILLFLVCCLCFILKIMVHNRKKRRRDKRRRIRRISESESETETESSRMDSEDADGRRWRRRGKRSSRKMDALRDRSRKWWDSIKTRKVEEEEEDGTRPKSSIQGRKEEDDGNGARATKKRSDIPGDVKSRGSGLEKKRVSYKNVADTDTDEEDTRLQRHSDTAAKERRELIALLEELKSLESETSQRNNKKEVKSVFVQYMTQDCDPPQGCHLVRSSDYPARDDDPTSGKLVTRNKCYPFNRSSLCDRGAGTQSGDVGVLDKFRRMSNELRRELVRGDAEDVAFKFDILTRMLNRLPLGDVSPRRRSILLEEMEHFRQPTCSRKCVHLKDDGVLCRL